MAAHTQPGRSGPYRGTDERWQRMWGHREQLLKIARRRSMCHEDAEDAVHEAMLRAVENPNVEDERLGAWLTVVTMRLCADRHRQVNRDVEVGSRSSLAAPIPTPLEEVVCDRAEARWLARRSDELPSRQAEALWLKAEDLDVGQVARKMGLSYRTVESLLARARRTLRKSLAGTFAIGLWLCGRGRPPTGSGAQAAAVASTAATVVALSLALPVVQEPHGTAPAQPMPGRSVTDPGGTYDMGPAASSGAAGTLPEPGRAGGGAESVAPADGGALSTVSSMVPELSPPGVFVLSVPALQRLSSTPPFTNVPSLRSLPSDLPSLPDGVSTPSGGGDAHPPAIPAPSDRSAPSPSSSPSAQSTPDEKDPGDVTRRLGATPTKPPLGSLHTHLRP